MLIQQAILHILDKGNQNLLLSENEMSIDENYIRDYINRLLTKIQKTDLKTGKIDSATFFNGALSLPVDLVTLSKQIATLCFDAMVKSEDMPPADYLFFVGRDDIEVPYFGFIRLDYQVGYTRHLQVNDGIMNQLIEHQAIFPSPTQLPSEAFICNLTDLTYQLLEKKYTFENEKRFYLSTDVLSINPEESSAAYIKNVRKTVQSIAKRFDEPTYERMSQTQKEIYVQLEEESGIDVNKVIEEVFQENTGALAAAKHEIEALKVPEKIAVRNVDKYEQKYRKQKYRLSNGIEISIPMELYQNQEIVEFINEPNGTISVIIKNIEEIKSRFQ